MNARRVTLLLFVTVISLLTIFLVVLLDDDTLAANDSGNESLRNLNLSQMSPEGMLAFNQTFSRIVFQRDELEPTGAV